MSGVVVDAVARHLVEVRPDVRRQVDVVELRARVPQRVPDLGSDLGRLVEEIYSTDAITVLRRFMPRAAADPDSLVRAIASRNADW